MPVLTAEQAAGVISPHVIRDLGHDTPPDQRHAQAFAKEVAAALGLEPNHHNVAHILDLLDKHEIRGAVGVEYPKYVLPWGVNPKSRDADSKKILVSSREEEDEATSKPKA